MKAFKKLFKTDNDRFLNLNDVVEFPGMERAKYMEKNESDVQMIKSSGYLMRVSMSDYKKIYSMLEANDKQNTI